MNRAAVPREGYIMENCEKAIFLKLIPAAIAGPREINEIERVQRLLLLRAYYKINKYHLSFPETAMTPPVSAIPELRYSGHTWIQENQSWLPVGSQFLLTVLRLSLR